jgi:16S rRNA (guanine966-N2)-methyltransferase
MKMRVIAGRLGGRFFAGPNSTAAHPMAERVRGAMFNSLGDISGCIVLDAFGGSGALAFEAVSRGAALVTVCERDKRTQRVIADNIRVLGLEAQVKLIKASSGAWSDNNPYAQVDLLLCDPPYHDLQLSTVSKLTRHVKYNGRMVLSYPGRESAPTVNGVVVVDSKSYGDAALAYYRKPSEVKIIYSAYAKSHAPTPNLPERKLFSPKEA